MEVVVVKNKDCAHIIVNSKSYFAYGEPTKLKGKAFKLNVPEREYSKEYRTHIKKHYEKPLF